MFTGAVFLNPGQEIREFIVIRTGNRETENGRELRNAETPIKSIRAILAKATSEEIDRWKQLGHQVSHKIIQQGTATFDILPGDIFERAGRKFYNQGMPNNIGDLGHWTIYFCDERSDV